MDEERPSTPDDVASSQVEEDVFHSPHRGQGGQDATAAVNCPKCSEIVGDVDGICCDFCSTWYHHSCLNPKLRGKTIKSFIQEEFVFLKCYECLSRGDPIQINPAVSPDGIQGLSQGGSDRESQDPIAVSGFPIVTIEDDKAEFIVCHGERDPLSNFFYSPIRYKNQDYFSVEQGYHHIRAVNAGDNALASAILNSSTSYEVKQLSKNLPRRLVNTQEMDDDVNLMRSLLQAKARQSLVMREALRKSTGKTIVHSTYPNDKFWASGVHFKQTEFPNGFPGRNMHGVLIMEVRDALLPEKDYEPFSNFETNHPNQRSLPRRATPKPLCFHCGVAGHLTKNCRHLRRKIFCDNCGAEGHKKAYCLRRQVSSEAGLQPRGGHRGTFMPTSRPLPLTPARPTPPYRRSPLLAMPPHVATSRHVPFAGMRNTRAGQGWASGVYGVSNVNLSNNRNLHINDLNDLVQFPPLSTLV